MGFFRTKDPKTGEPRLGAGVYLIICALMVAGVILWHVRQNANDPAFLRDQAEGSQVKRNPSDLEPVAKAAEEHQTSVSLDNTPGVASDKTSSNRGYALGTGPNTDPTKNVAPEEKDNLDTIQNTIELLRQNQAKAEQEKAEAVAKAKAEAETEIAKIRKRASVTRETEGGSPRATRPPSNDQGNNINSQALVIYDVQHDAAVKAAAAKAAAAEANKVAPTGFETGAFLPRGWMFPVYVLTTIQTVNQEDIVVLGVAENVIFQHKVQIPFGTRLLGTAAATNFEDRIAINVDTILYPDGRELPISALLKDSYDLASGVRGYYIPQPMSVQLAPYVSQFVNVWTQAMAQRYSNNGNNTGSTNNGEITRGAIDQTSDLITDQAKKIQDKLDRRYPEKVVVPIGTKAYAQLRSPLDLTRAQIAGSLGNKQPVLPGFQNNPISAGGNIERTANYGTPSQVTSASPTSSSSSPQPVALSPEAAQSVRDTSAQAQSYISALQQLNQLDNQLKSMQQSRATAPSGSSSKINWPSGDIQ